MKHATAFLVVYACLLFTIWLALTTLAPGSIRYLVAGIETQLTLATGD